MSLEHFPELLRLPKRKRMQLADELWLSCMDDRSKMPKWHQTTLDQRWSAYRDGKVKRISLKELERRLGGR
jgi:putative addiction module component (TIGR02574 family)